MASRVLEFPPRVETQPEPEEECFDLMELAAQARDAVEAYMRAPWKQQAKSMQLSHLRRAVELIERIEGLESGRIPMKIWGD